MKEGRPIHSEFYTKTVSLLSSGRCLASDLCRQIFHRIIDFRLCNPPLETVYYYGMFRTKDTPYTGNELSL